MPAVVVDSSILITLAAGEQFDLLRQFYGSIHIPPKVWDEVVLAAKAYGIKETQQARAQGWLLVNSPKDLLRIQVLPFHLQAGETEALALALEFPDPLVLIDDAQGRRAAQALGLAYTGTLGVLLRARREGKIAALKPILERLAERTTFWLGREVYAAVLKEVNEAGN